MNTLMTQFYKISLTQKLNEKLQELFLSDNIISIGWFTNGITTPSIITKDMISSNIKSSNLITLYKDSYKELYDNIDEKNVRELKELFKLYYSFHDETVFEFIYLNDNYDVLFSQTILNSIK